MSSEQIMKGNIKLTVFDSFEYKELIRICDAIIVLGYDCKICDNGNVVFQKIKNEELK